MFVSRSPWLVAGLLDLSIAHRHAVASSLRILGHLEHVCGESEGPQYAVSELQFNSKDDQHGAVFFELLELSYLFQLSDHLAHLYVLGGIHLRGKCPQSLLHCFLVSGWETRHLRKLLVVCRLSALISPAQKAVGYLPSSAPARLPHPPNSTFAFALLSNDLALILILSSLRSSLILSSARALSASSSSPSISTTAPPSSASSFFALVGFLGSSLSSASREAVAASIAAFQSSSCR